jgi:hypothetical protein
VGKHCAVMLTPTGPEEVQSLRLLLHDVNEVSSGLKLSCATEMACEDMRRLVLVISSYQLI